MSSAPATALKLLASLRGAISPYWIFWPSDQERNKIATYLNEARKLARDSVLATQQAMKEQVDANRRQAPNYQPGDLVMAIQPYVPTGGSLKLARLYNGPYKIESYLPGHRTLQLTHLHTTEPRLAHIDNVKRYVAADHLRPTLIPEAPIPQPTPEAELRVIDQLERAAGTAKHVLGAGRARATTEHILGSSSLPPLPDLAALPPLPDMAGLLSWPLIPPLPQPVPPSAARPAVNRKQPSSTPVVPPPPILPAPKPHILPLDEVQDLPSDLRPWFLPGPSSHAASTTTTKYGRSVRPPAGR